MKIAFLYCTAILFVLLLCTAELAGQVPISGKTRVVFYNVENLFDPSDDPATNDGEFTPTGKNHWTITRLNHKVMMIYRAIIAASDGHFPDIIGLAEIENLRVIEYLIRNTPLKDGNYGILHKESPDMRGIDVALLYRKETINPVDFDFIPVRDKGSSKLKSRDILHFKAKISQETLHFFVNHWPSRSGGYIETKGKREIAAHVVKQFLDSLFVLESKGKFLLMGDFNATPDEKCFTEIVGASLLPVTSNTSRLYNLSQLWMRDKTGTIRTRGHWEIFDQFICSNELANGTGLTISLSETTICTAAFLLETDSRYLGKKPFRTYLGPAYQGGVSDHLPISTVLFHRVPKGN